MFIELFIVIKIDTVAKNFNLIFWDIFVQVTNVYMSDNFVCLSYYTVCKFRAEIYTLKKSVENKKP